MKGNIMRSMGQVIDHLGIHLIIIHYGNINKRTD